MALVFSQGGDDGSDEGSDDAGDGAAWSCGEDAADLRGVDGASGFADASACGSNDGVAGPQLPGGSLADWLVGVDAESGDQRGAFLFQRGLASGLAAGHPLPARAAACAGDAECGGGHSAVGGGAGTARARVDVNCLRRRAAPERSTASQAERHRQRADDPARGPGQGEEGPQRDAESGAAGDATGLLEGIEAAGVAVSGPGRETTPAPDLAPAGLQAGEARGPHHQAGQFSLLAP